MKKISAVLVIFLVAVIQMFGQYKPMPASDVKSTWISYDNNWINIYNETKANNLACALYNARRNTVFLSVGKNSLRFDVNYTNQLKMIVRNLHDYNISVVAYYMDGGAYFPEDLFDDVSIGDDEDGAITTFIKFMNETSVYERFDGLLVGVEPWTSDEWDCDDYNGVGNCYDSNNPLEDWECPDCVNYRNTLVGDYLSIVEQIRSEIATYLNNSNWGEGFKYGGVVSKIWHKRYLYFENQSSGASFSNGNYVKIGNGIGFSDYFDFIVPEAYCSGSLFKETLFSSNKASGEMQWIVEKIEINDLTSLESGRSMYWHAIDNDVKMIIGVGVGRKQDYEGNWTYYCFDPEDTQVNSQYPYIDEFYYQDDYWGEPDAGLSSNIIDTHDGLEEFILYHLSPNNFCQTESVYGTSAFPGRNLLSYNVDPTKLYRERLCYLYERGQTNSYDPSSNLKSVDVTICESSIELSEDVCDIKLYDLYGRLVDEYSNTNVVEVNKLLEGPYLIQLIDTKKGINEVYKVYLK